MSEPMLSSVLTRAAADFLRHIESSPGGVARAADLEAKYGQQVAEARLELLTDLGYLCGAGYDVFDHDNVGYPQEILINSYTLTPLGVDSLRDRLCEDRVARWERARGWITTVIACLALILSVLNFLSETGCISLAQWLGR